MAKVLGESGRFATQEADTQRYRILLRLIVMMVVVGVILGLNLSFVIPLSWLPTWGRLIVQALTIVLMVFVSKWSFRRLDQLEKNRQNWQRGAKGENIVGEKLTNFPDDFCVINDLTTPFGNLDHVVIGPTGVYVLDAKSWRGIVASDGKGELLLNGQPTDKQQVRQFVGRIMSIKEKVRILAPGLDPFYQPAFVFTSARVEAKWGTTGSVHCVTDDYLYEYIVEKKFGTRLKPHEVQAIAQAFLGLAHMDREFASTKQR